MEDYEIIDYEFINSSGEWETVTHIVYDDECSFNIVEKPSEDKS